MLRRTRAGFGEKLLGEFDRFLKTVAVPATTPAEPTPGAECGASTVPAAEKQHVAGLMRINHTGEVCAQALYYGQALWAEDETTRQKLHQAAAEEYDHLCWCQERLHELNAKPSIFNPFWYASSFALGSFAAAFGDPVSYGFVIETERQVEAHLDEHLQQLPESDCKSRAILARMKDDEIRHGNNAREAGGVDLPEPVRKAMTAMSKFMKALAYRL
jgi:ubiquinone biosynthesis monooxygenase Coq7